MSLAPARFTSRCLPPVWARGGHAQTVLGHLLPSEGGKIDARSPGWTPVEIPLEDGEKLRVYRHAGTTGVRVHMLHGLSGDVNSDYMRRTAGALLAAGHEVWAVNHRGCGTGQGLAQKPYHSGKIEDLQSVLASSRSLGGAERYLVIGFSLSGNLALLHAAREPESAADGLIAVNPPVDLDLASRLIGRGLNRIYELRFLHRLSAEVRRRKQRGGLKEAASVSRWSSLMEFDDRVTAPTSGFTDGADYYARCSSRKVLDDVQRPGVILSSEDDPFVPVSSYDGWTGSSSLRLHIEKHGGHVGYLDESWMSGARWLDEALLHYVSKLATS